MTSVRLTTALRAIVFALAATGASAAACAQDAERRISEMTAGKPAEVGVAWIADGKAHAVNNADGYPMMSVFKLHGAVAELRQMERRGTPADTLITVRAAEMEKLLEDGINSIGLGPQGMGGKMSVMGVNIENTARHPSTIGVAVNVGCWSHRRGHIIFDKDLNYEITTHSGVTL